MPYEVSQEIAKYLPPDVITVRPLEFDWAEAINAVVFTSRFDRQSFPEWEEALIEYYRSALGRIPQVRPETDEELGCITFRINLDPSNLPKGTISVDISVAWCNQEDSLENLNAWLGSKVLASIVRDDKPAMAGLVRIRP